MKPKNIHLNLGHFIPMVSGINSTGTCSWDNLTVLIFIFVMDSLFKYRNYGRQNKIHLND